MHYSVEYRLFDKTCYMVEPNEPKWFIDEGYKLSKPWPPKRRGLPKVKAQEAPA
jgi:hypothetical protein